MKANGSDPPSLPEPSEDLDGIAMSIFRTNLPDHAHAHEESPHVNQPEEASLPVPLDQVGDLRPRTKAGFHHLYGWMGMPMIVIFLLSAMWTFILAVIQQFPTQIANYLMDTANLDYGEFWLLPMADPDIAISAIVLLVLFGIGFISLVVLMLFPDKLMTSRWNRRDDQVAGSKPVGNTEPLGPKIRPIAKQEGSDAAGVEGITKRVSQSSTGIPTGLSWARVKYEATSPHGILRQYYNPLLDLPKLIFQTITLFTYLHNGFPVAVIYIYSCALFVNWMISCYRYKSERPDPHFIACRIFYSFDLFFAVFAPLEVLVYAYYSFHFEREVFATRVATLAAASFDRTARLFADPTEVSMFRIAMHYLQFTTVGSLLIKSALNALSIFKWWSTIVHLVDHARTTPTQRESLRIGAIERKVRDAMRRRKQVQNLFIAGLFFCAGMAVFIHSIIAVVSTRNVCRPHPQCKVPSYQWNVGAEHCSCIVFVDREIGLKTIAEWENPPDTTANLAALAVTGHLRIIQVINRQVETLPDELRGCHDLEQLILIYTKTVSIPDWAKEFTRLEYLHIEGDFTSKQLTYMPHDLFQDMRHLLFLHLGCLVKLPAIPNLDNLDHLQYLVFAVLHSVTTIPSFASLHSLKRLHIIDTIQVNELPSVRALAKLKTFSIANRIPVCCNGFLTGTCDLSNFSCLDRTASGEPLVQCTTKRISADDYMKLMVTTKGDVCTPVSFDIKDGQASLDSVDKACGGVMNKQCSIYGVVGICYPVRMQPVSRQSSPEYTNLRRLQIERGVGERCDPVVEAWLGCKA